MEIFLAVCYGLSTLLLGLVLLAVVFGLKAQKAQGIAILTALQSAGEASARTREADSHRLNEALFGMGSKIDVFGKALADSIVRMELAEEQRSALLQATAGTIEGHVNKSAQYSQGLLIKLEALGPVAKTLSENLEKEAYKRIESHSWLASELKSEISNLSKQLVLAHTESSGELKIVIQRLVDQISGFSKVSSTSQSDLTEELKGAIDRFTQKIEQLKSSLEESLKF